MSRSWNISRAALFALALAACANPESTGSQGSGTTPSPSSPGNPSPSDPGTTPAPDPGTTPAPDPGTTPAPDPVPPAPTPLPAPASYVWKGDFSTGDISQYSSPQSWSPNEENWDPSRLTVTTSQPPSGTEYALKVTLKAGEYTYNYNHSPPYPLNARSELTHEDALHEGDERWYRWQVYFPGDFAVEDGKGGGATFTQWHHYSPSEGEPGSPPLLFVAKTDSFNLIHVPALNSGTDETLWSAPLVKDQWHTFVFHVVFSSDKSKGLVDLYLDGKQVLNEHTNTMFSGFTNYMKLGLYRRPTATPDNVIYIAGMVEALNKSDVMPE